MANTRARRYYLFRIMMEDFYLRRHSCLHAKHSIHIFNVNGTLIIGQYAVLDTFRQCTSHSQDFSNWKSHFELSSEKKRNKYMCKSFKWLHAIMSNKPPIFRTQIIFILNIAKNVHLSICFNFNVFFLLIHIGR